MLLASFFNFLKQKGRIKGAILIKVSTDLTYQALEDFG